MTVRIVPSAIGGAMQVPPSKSMAHRLLICAALAGGASRIENIAPSADIGATMGALRLLGTDIRCEGDTVVVAGLQNGRPAYAGMPVDCGESGSTLRFLIPLFSLAGTKTTFTGARRLFERPLAAYRDIFAEQGLEFTPQESGLTIQGTLAGGRRYVLAGDVSSQFVSGLLFVLPLLAGESSIEVRPPFESRSYVELTRAAQSGFGVTSHWADENTLLVPGGQQYRPGQFVVEGDWSQGAVPAVLGAVCGGVSIAGLAPGSVQGDKVILDIVRRCGAKVQWNGEMLLVSPPEEALVAAGDIDLSDCPDLGPILCALALFCRGATRLVNAGRLRIKESDRILSVESEFRKLGAAITSNKNSVAIEGGRLLQAKGAACAHNDHRVVMALTAVAACAGLSLSIEGVEAINKSWPGFFEDMARIGIQTDIQWR